MKDRSRSPTRVGSVKGNGPTASTNPDEEQDEEEGPFTPADESGRDEGEKRDGVGGGDQRDVLRVADGRVRPRAQVVAAVEVPVPETPEDLGHVGGGRRRRDRLRELQDVHAVGGLHLEPGHPPHARAEGEDADARRGRSGVAPGGLAQHDHGVEDPQEWRDADVDDGRRVDAAHARHDEGEQRRLAPPAAAQGDDGEPDEERQPRPGQEDHRDPSGVLEEVRGEHVRQRGGHRARPVEAEHPAEIDDAGAGDEEDGAEPEPLGHPDGHPEEVEDDVEGSHRQEVADVLVTDRPERDARVPEERDLTEELRRIEVQVRLGVGGDHAGPDGEGRDVSQGGQDEQATDPPPAIYRPVLEPPPRFDRAHADALPGPVSRLRRRPLRSSDPAPAFGPRRKAAGHPRGAVEVGELMDGGRIRRSVV